jgi:formylglycine-generating enzyme required for sulfatase activity
VGDANKPVTYVSWFDAIRFCNWYTNQKAGLGNNTESGAYAITGGGANSGTVSVLPNHYDLADPTSPKYTYLLPTQSEWVKAAYYKGQNTGNLSAGYWKYPTKSDTAPSATVPPGGSNSANYLFAGSPSGLTTVGAYAGSPGPYGTSDQGGNVKEWTEQLTSYFGLTYATVRGGAWSDSSSNPLSSIASSIYARSVEANSIGFRVAMVPEPSSIAMLLGGAIVGLIWWWRRRR